MNICPCKKVPKRVLYGMPLSPIGTVIEGKCIVKAMDRTLVFKGMLDVLNPGRYLDPFFEDLHKNVLEHNVKMVIVDLRRLKYINSSSIRCLVTWLITIKNMPKDQSYVLYFVCLESKAWQNDMVKTFQMLLPECIKVKVV